MIKLPEPVGATYTIAGIQHCTITEVLPDTNLYTEAQLKQAMLDVLEEAFQVAGPEDSYQDEHFKAKADSSMRIRVLIKEIPE